MKPKAQIAIEFLIVFAFVLLVFLFLFSLITQQRAVIQNTQTYSQLQLIAQNIALQISRASLSGSGYSAQLPLLTSVGVIPYNLSITSSGAVIVTSTTAKQAVRASAFSSARGISSNPAYLAPGSSTVYNIPIANGSISIQNSFGTVCIDYQCPTNANQSSSISLSSQVIHAAQFNGAAGGSQFSGSDSSSVQSNTGQGFSVSAWVYPTNISTSRGITQGDSYVFRIDSPGEGNKLSWFVYINSAIEPRLSSTGVLKLNKWYHVVGTYNSSTGYMGLYINGVLNNSETRAGSPTLGYCSCFNIGVGSSSDWAGKIANLQIYNAGLSANQVKALYSNGIAGGPVNSTYLKGWWTLNGNANDYSGYGENLVGGTILFPTVAQIFAAVKNPMGQAVNNILVGFSTTLGNFTNGLGAQGQSSAAYTNSNGVASTFLNQQGNNGQALVKATALNSNALPQSSLIAWYPMNLGQGSVAYDISGNKNNGAFVGQPYWSSPNYVANFSGYSPSQQTQIVSVFPSTASAGTGIYLPVGNEVFDMWFKTTSFTGGLQVVGAYGSSSSPTGAGCDRSIYLSNGILNFNIWSEVNFAGNTPVNDGRWHNLAYVLNRSSGEFAYVDGILYAGTSLPTSNCGVGCSGFNTATDYVIGNANQCRGSPSGGPFNGLIAGVGIYNSPLTQKQITQIYNAGLGASPFMPSNLLFWWPLNGDAIDYSNNNNATIYGNVNFVSAAKSLPPQQIAGANSSKVLAASFSGTNSYVLAGNVPQINSLSNWTVMFWMNSTITYNYRNPFDANFIPTANNAGPRFEQGGTGGANALNLILGTSGSNYNVFTYANTIIPNTWYQVIASRSGNTIMGYLNGVMAFNSSNTKWPSAFPNVTIGRGFSNGAERQFSGNISNVQIYNQTISSQQASALYNEGIGGIPLSGTRLAAWWQLGGNPLDSSLNSNNGIAVNVVYKNKINYVPSLLQSLNYSGINLNGQTSYLNSGFTNLPSGSSARSVFAWVYLNKAGGTPRISSYGNEGVNQISILGVTSNTLFFSGWSDDYVSSLQVTPGMWHFVGYTYNAGSTQVTLWVDGKSQTGSLSGGSALNTVLSYSYIGAGRDNVAATALNGSITNLQIYNNALSSSQVQQLFNSQIPPSSSTTVPLSWYP